MKLLARIVLGALLGSCAVDEAAIDDLPCPCASGFVCVESTQRCAPEGPDAGQGGDAGSAGRDPDLGDCLITVQDDFEGETYDPARWGETTDNDASVAFEEGALVTRVPANALSDYAFLFSREQIDLSACTILVELVEAHPGESPDNFFSVRNANNRGVVGFGVRFDEIRASHVDLDGERTVVFEADYDPQAHRWLALRGIPGGASWLVSADGAEWNEVARSALTFSLEDVQSLFGVGMSRDSDAPLRARFDNYNLPTR